MAGSDIHPSITYRAMLQGLFPTSSLGFFPVASTFTLCSPSVFPALLSHRPFSLVLISLSFSEANANGPHFPLSMA